MTRKWMKKGFGINLRIGTRIVGKWQNKTYTVIRKLGSGMVGSVYLCNHEGNYVALKISRQPLSMTKEVNVLQSLAKAQDEFLGPSLFDVDDWIINEKESYSFYVMEYIKGDSFSVFMRRHNREWIGVILIQLLEQLHHLHMSGWVFGDLKVENLIVEHESKKVRFIDVGGTTKVGRSLKEYTEFYDRGYWGLGSRKAEASYDLFALVMIFLAVYYPNQFKKSANPIRQIDDRIKRIKDLHLYERYFKKAIRGEYNSANQMKRDIVKSFLNSRKKVQKKKEKSLLEPLLILIVVNFFYIGAYLIF